MNMYLKGKTHFLCCIKVVFNAYFYFIFINANMEIYFSVLLLINIVVFAIHNGFVLLGELVHVHNTSQFFVHPVTLPFPLSLHLMIPSQTVKDLPVSYYLFLIYTLGFSYKRNKVMFKLVSILFHLAISSQGASIFLHMTRVCSSVWQSSSPLCVSFTFFFIPSTVGEHIGCIQD